MLFQQSFYGIFCIISEISLNLRHSHNGICIQYIGVGTTNHVVIGCILYSSKYFNKSTTICFFSELFNSKKHTKPISLTVFPCKQFIFVIYSCFFSFYQYSRDAIVNAIQTGAMEIEYVQLTIHDLI